MRDVVIAVDFDGTIVEHQFPQIGEMRPGAKDVLQALHKRGVRLIIWTCRSGRFLDEAIAWLRNNDIPFDAVNQNLPSLGFETSAKIYADIYIDDRSLGGLPSWVVISDWLDKLLPYYEVGMK